MYDNETYIIDTNAATGQSVDPGASDPINVDRQVLGPASRKLRTRLNSTPEYGAKLTEWCRNDKPDYPWLTNNLVPSEGDGGGAPGLTAKTSQAQGNKRV